MNQPALSSERLTDSMFDASVCTASPDSTTFPNSTAKFASGMARLAVEMIRPPAEVDFSLYLYTEGESQPRLYRDRKYPITPADIKHLKNSGTEYLYIVSNEVQQYCEYLKDTVVQDTMVAPTLRYDAIRQATRTAYSNASAGKQIKEVVEVSEYIGQNTVDLICEDDVLLTDLFDVMTHDYDTFNHAVNVSTYCVLIACQLGFSDRESLVQIAQGALLHDFGKQFLPREILNKTTPLTEEQKEIVMEHPHRGFKELCRRADLSWGQLMMVYQHHERCDGRGYPVTLHGNEIHQWARICAVADVFDAMSRNRPYRRAIDDADVLAYLDRQAGRGFDEEVVRCLIQTTKTRR